jgi:Sec-independent protein translocase protein TatA
MKALHYFYKTPAMDRLLRWGAIALLVWLVVLVIGAGAQSLHNAGKAAAAIREYQRLKGDAAQPRREADETIRKLQRNNLFVAPPSRTQLPQTVAILGDSVLIGDQWYREGQEVQGYQVTQIGPDFVRVVRDGQEHRLVPFDVEVNYGRAAASGPAGGRGRDTREGGQRGPRGRGGGPMMPTGDGTQSPPQPPEDFRARMMEMRERVESMTPDQRREMFERFRNASPEERERMRDEFMRGRGQ